MAESNRFKLMFHGAADDSPETLRNVKTALVAELGFSAEEAKRFFDRTPAMLLSAPSPQELAAAEKLLERSGALVQIISSGNEAVAGPQANDQEEEEEDDSDLLIEFEASEDTEPMRRTPEKKRPVKVYTIEEEPPPACPAPPPEPSPAQEIDQLLNQFSSSGLLNKAEEDLEDLVARSAPTKPKSAPPAPTAEKKPAPMPKLPPLAEQPLAQQVSKKPPPPAGKTPPPDEDGPFKLSSVGRPAAKPKPEPLPETPEPRSLQFARDIVYAGALSLAILVIGLWFITEGDISKRKGNLEKRLESIVEEIQKETAEDAKPKTPPETGSALTAAEELPDRKLSTRFIVEHGELTSLEVELTTPEPRALTDAEVLNGQRPRPWLQRVVFRDAKIASKPGGSFIASGSGKLFIKSEKGHERFTGAAVVTGTLSENPPRLTAKILMNLGFDQLPKNSAFLFEPAADEGYRFFLSAEVDARGKK